MRDSTRREALRIIDGLGSVFRSTSVTAAGVHPRTIYSLRDAGIVEGLGWGLYRSTNLPPLSHPDLVTVASRAPRSVFFLISALSFHGLTTRIPHRIQIAIERGEAAPRIDYPPTKVFWRSSRIFNHGIEVHDIDGIRMRIYSREKSLVDSFQYRNKLGLDFALEALRLYRDAGKIRINMIRRFAETSRVWNAMRPYLEATI